MIAGIEPVTSGKIFFNEHEVSHLPPQERNVSMAFESYNLYPHLKVYDNIAFPLRAPRWNLKLSKQDEQRRVEEIARFLGIDELLDRLPQHLSGGQKQRVSLARALVRQPEVYLLDEPIAHLDARLKFSTQTLLKEFATKYRSTIIYVTHDYREALGLSDRIAILRKGEVEQESTPEELYNHPATDFVGSLLGEPPMNLVDGVVVSKDNQTYLEVQEGQRIRVEESLLDTLKNKARRENGKELARMGIRVEDIRLSRQKISDNSIQLPVYAIAHEAESSIVTFELKKSFLHVRTRSDKGVCDYNLSEKVWLEFDQSRMFFYHNTVDLSEV
jgi:ABC-type sugar transport system ATPase subunit